MGIEESKKTKKRIKKFSSGFFNWKKKGLSDFKKVLLISFSRNIPVTIRGLSTEEGAMNLLRYRKKLLPDQIEFLEGLIEGKKKKKKGVKNGLEQSSKYYKKQN